MQIIMNKEEFDKALKEAETKGQKEALSKLNKVMTVTYDDMTKGIFSRLGREANIEMTRRFINIIRDELRKL
ncbi:hypothetical protein AU156_gp194 [Edwardsiella phage PEi20]|uniref:Uncharacterized protein n=1 Tax=Edwardsiella phage PEi20 TaxID=1608310 RepID=A0A0B6VLC4_9CAUD|nr:hypothetical protein AU156_gp194 [Edwardsiella phage PEi20]BAQ22907.1 conserved hypothetical protein [Edwardsiella phage PEi20]